MAKDVTVIIPVHEFNGEVEKYLARALKSVSESQGLYEGKLKAVIVTTPEIAGNEFMTGVKGCSVHVNASGKYDFCSMVNDAVETVETEYFSILEFDDEYAPKYFRIWDRYLLGNEEVSLFLPINVVHDVEEKKWQYGNEMALASSFAEELGFVDFDCLDKFSMFNITGGIFNTEDFKKIGKLKPSIKLAFGYELLLRMTCKDFGLKVMVLPKIGYYHTAERAGSLSERYKDEIPVDEIPRWYELAKREYTFKTDRWKTIVMPKAEEIK